jgi:hypothetical protein
MIEITGLDPMVHPPRNVDSIDQRNIAPFNDAGFFISEYWTKPKYTTNEHQYQDSLLKSYATGKHESGLWINLLTTAYLNIVLRLNSMVSFTRISITSATTGYFTCP